MDEKQLPIACLWLTKSLPPMEFFGAHKSFLKQYLFSPLVVFDPTFQTWRESRSLPSENKNSKASKNDLDDLWSSVVNKTLIGSDLYFPAIMGCTIPNAT
mmetsp:Transcript_22398/g.46124  ORF Transcript_22398/g.46124 Transcript_22398/m.46124 type:complete len:100 (-) Transcript_22398:985-1284(-)